MRIFVLCFLFSVILARLSLAQDEVVVALDAGNGPLQVGILGTEGIVDEGHFGPQALAADQDGRLHVLDQNNSRVLILDTDGTRQGQYLIPRGVPASDLVILGSDVFVWGNGPAQLSPDSASLLAAGDGGAPEAVVEAFSAMGSREPTPIEELRETSIELLSANEDVDPIRSVVTDPSGGTLTLTTVLSENHMSANIADPTGQSLARISISAGMIGSVIPLALTDDRSLFVLAEVYASSGAFTPALYIVEFSAAATEVGHYKVPLEGAADVPRRFVTVTPGGQVFALRNEQVSSEIILLARQEGTLAPGLRLDMDAQNQTTAALANRSRQSMLDTATDLESIVWVVTPTAHDPNPRRCVVGGNPRTSRPWFINGMVGQEVIGVPYNWGGMVTNARYVQDIADGRKAGNVCTSDPGLMSNTTGNDCSGHVSVVWGLTTKYSTSNLSTVSRSVPRPQSELKTGDILNKAGSHVRIFVRYLSGGMIETSESAINCNGLTGRTCRSTYLLSTMLASGYVPLRFNGAVQ